MFPRKLRTLPLLLLGLLSASAALANPFETTLKNGLKVIVKEDRRAPTAVHMVWYKVGSMDEVDGTSGLAHALEHMMFKGTPKVGPGEFNKRVAAAGGRDNAFTNYDYTAYFQQIPKQKLPEMMALEADRMSHLTLDPKEFAKEIQVIMEERRMRTDDNPQSLLFEALNAAAYQAHPYRRPVIGWMADLEQMTAADLRDWYRRWYVPNNATLVVVGDVDHQAVFREAEKTYGKVRSRAIESRKPIAEAPQKGIRRITVKGPAELPQVLLAWKAPVLRDVNKDADPYALEMLGAVLDGHDAARLTRHLVKEQRLAQGVGSAYDTTSRGPSLFFLMATPAEGHTPAELEAALKAEVARIAAEGVSEEELQRARAQLVASQVYKRDSMFAQAMEIGQMEIVGLSYRAVDTMIDKLKAVTAADVQRVARQYFNDDSLTVGLLEPQPLDEAPRRRATAGARH
jgi:zinc protease